MKRKIVIVLVLDLLLAMVIFPSSIYDDFGLAAAYVDWVQNPTPEKRAILDRRHRISMIRQYIVMGSEYGSIYCVLVVLTVPFVIIAERRKSRRVEQQR